MIKLEKGDKAPDINAVDQDGNLIKLNNKRYGKR